MGDMIEQDGWSSIEWDNDYTLLHWAAKNNKADLCARFMLSGADPLHCDAAGKDAFEYAREFESREALLQLDAGPPVQLQGSRVVMTPVSHKNRRSLAVLAHPHLAASASDGDSVSTCSIDVAVVE